MRKFVTLGSFAFCLYLLTGCSSIQTVNFKIHTEPEGAQIIYQQDNHKWIYLGTSPLDVVETIDTDQLSKDYVITVKAMRCGYIDQAKEWPRREFEQELDEKGQLFWTPRLIKANP